MPIQGLTTGRKPYLPRVGKIRIGAKVRNANGVEHPTALDHFVFPDEFADLAARVYGREPKELTIAFTTDDMDENAAAFYKAYGGSQQVMCRGDGEFAERTIYDDQARQVGENLWDGPIARARGSDDNRNRPAHKYRIVCPGRDCPYYTAKRQECGEVMSLQFILPDLIDEPDIHGVWQLDTGSFWSIVQTYDSIAYLHRFGSIAGKPLRMCLEPRKVVRQDGGSNTVYTIQLKLAGRLSALIASPQPALAALPEGRTPAPDETRDELLYPVNGFAPDPEPPADGNAAALASANAAPMGMAPVDLRREAFDKLRQARDIVDDEDGDLSVAVQLVEEVIADPPGEDIADMAGRAKTLLTERGAYDDDEDVASLRALRDTMDGGADIRDIRVRLDDLMDQELSAEAQAMADNLRGALASKGAYDEVTPAPGPDPALDEPADDEAVTYICITCGEECEENQVDETGECVLCRRKAPAPVDADAAAQAEVEALF